MKNIVAKLRKKYKVSQETLARKMGVSRQTISSIENEKYNPSILLAIRIARYFNRMVEDVFLFTEMTAESILPKKTTYIS